MSPIEYMSAVPYDAQKNTLLIVDDALPNRLLLQKIFGEQYNVVLACDGVEALEKLRSIPDIAVCVLDIVMPKLDGYGVLEAMRADEDLHNIPVVIITADNDSQSQIKAFESGAYDFILKPFVPQIILHRVNNIVSRRQLDRLNEENRIFHELLRQSETDEKTGISSKQAFCRETGELLRSAERGSHILVRFDVDNFKIYNDVFGTAAGDDFLRYVGSRLEGLSEFEMTCCRWEADNFALCLKREDFEQHALRDELLAIVEGYISDFVFIPRIGVYVIDDPTLDPILMSDRAFLALRSIKGTYDKRVAYYDSAMRDAIIEEQAITAEMQGALDRGEFVAYFQPQYNYAAERLYGAEALVRWKHPQRGLLTPDKFIGVFERNGFISRMDRYIWEQTCCYIRKWLDDGLEVVPISVNVSRRDLFNPHLCEDLTELVKKYDISPSYLRLEITETAHMKNSELITHVVDKLHAEGFFIEMDDFGSGYSSINTLKDVEVDLLKLDMNFLRDRETNTRSGSILSSVIRMAHWLRIPVIAEGVESRSQAEYLKSVGCHIIQGYFYARPMPASEFESLLARQTVETETIPFETTAVGFEEALDYLNISTQASLIFNSFVGGAAIAEYDGINLEALRMNDKFFETMGVSQIEYGYRFLHLFLACCEEDRELVQSCVDLACESGEETYCEFRTEPLGPGRHKVWISCRMRLLSKSDGRSLLYLAVENISDRMMLLLNNQELSKQLSAILDSNAGGILYYEIKPEQNDYRLIYHNETAARMFGFTTAEFEARFSEFPFDAIHPADRVAVHEAAQEVLRDGIESIQVDYRHITRSGEWRWVHMCGGVISRSAETVSASIFLFDIDGEVRHRDLSTRQGYYIERSENLLRAIMAKAPAGIALFTVEQNDELVLTGFNESLWRMLAYPDRAIYIEAIHRYGPKNNIFPDDFDHVVEKAYEAIREGESSIGFHVIRADGVMRSVRANFTLVTSSDGWRMLQVVAWDVTDHSEEELRALRGALVDVYDEVYELDLTTGLSWLRFAAVPRGYGTLQSRPTQELIAEIVAQAKQSDRRRLRAFLRRTVDGTKHESADISYERETDSGELLPTTITFVRSDSSSCILCFGSAHMDNGAVHRVKNGAILVDDGDFYRGIVVQNDTAAYDYDFTAHQFRCTEAFYKYKMHSADLKRPFDEVDGSDYVHAEDLFDYSRFIAHLKNVNGYTDCTVRLLMTDGTYRWTRMSVTLVRSSDGRPLRLLCILRDVDNTVRLRRMLAQTANRFDKIAASLPVAVAVFEVKDTLYPVYLSDRVGELFGFSRIDCDTFVTGGRTISDMFRDAETAAHFSELSDGTPVRERRFLAARRDGTHFWLSVTATYSTRSDGVLLCYTAMADATETVKGEKELSTRAELFRILSDTAGAVTFDYSVSEDTLVTYGSFDGIHRCDKVDENFTELASKSDLIEERLREEFVTVFRLVSAQPMRDSFDCQANFFGRGLRWYRANFASVADSTGAVYRIVGILDDIDDIIREQGEIIVNARHDGLTGVSTKDSGNILIKSELIRRPRDRFDALLFMDIDNFKQINDTIGHLDGDEVLKAIGECLRSSFRSEDIVSRFGGDEFVIYARAAGSVDAIRDRARRILELVSNLRIKGLPEVTVSIGICPVSGEGYRDFDDVMRRADAALYKAKTGGKNQIHVYNEDEEDTQ